MEQEFTFGGPIAWSPSAEQIEQTQLKQFMNAHGIATFAELVDGRAMISPGSGMPSSRN